MKPGEEFEMYFTQAYWEEHEEQGTYVYLKMEEEIPDMTGDSISDDMYLAKEKEDIREHREKTRAFLFGRPKDELRKMHTARYELAKRIAGEMGACQECGSAQLRYCAVPIPVDFQSHVWCDGCDIVFA